MQVDESGNPPKIYSRTHHTPSGEGPNSNRAYILYQHDTALITAMYYCIRIAGTVQVEDSRRNEIAPWWLRN